MPLPIESITIRNLLSFGPQAEPVELRPLNVLIGPNGSGKSNFIESLNLLSAMPLGFKSHINNQGGILHWLWKGNDQPIAKLSVSGTMRLREETNYEHEIEFSRVEQSLQVDDESIGFSHVRGRLTRKPLFQYERNVPVLRLTKKKSLAHADVDRTESALWRDQPSELLVALDPLSRFYRSFRFYRGRSLNHLGPAKQPQAVEQFSEFLLGDARNLGAVLNRINFNNMSKEILTQLKLVNENIEEFLVSLESGTLQVYLRETGLLAPIPASRVSDGTFRWLCLLAILLSPSPPPLMCIEEPDIGLHPDVIVELADLLKKASARTQLIVTTHSDTLVDALSDTPESILVCEKSNGQTSLRRLSESNLRDWLEEYGLGQLWRRGDLGGNRY
jgi:predicted ATPase